MEPVSVLYRPVGKTELEKIEKNSLDAIQKFVDTEEKIWIKILRMRWMFCAFGNRL